MVDEWISGDEPHTVSMPEDGAYTLTEVTAPDGFQTAESITFEIKDGAVEGGIVIMYDAPEVRKVTVSKKDLATSEELPGASLKVTNEKGDIMDEWVSTNTPHVIEGLADGTYTLTEVTAPDGYEVAEDIAFTITDGKVERGIVIMYDAPEEKKNTPSEPEKPNTPSEPEKPDKPDKPETPEKPDKPERPDKPEGSFYVSKRDAANSNELLGAKLKITDVDGNTVAEWTSTDTPHKITGLADGTYTLTEITAPQGYEVAESITFTVTDGKVEGNTVVMYDKALPGKPSGGGGHSGGGGGSHGGGGGHHGGGGHSR